LRLLACGLSCFMFSHPLSVMSSLKQEPLLPSSLWAHSDDTSSSSTISECQKDSFIVAEEESESERMRKEEAREKEKEREREKEREKEAEWKKKMERMRKYFEEVDGVALAEMQ
jgi:hypothetical protein